MMGRYIAGELMGTFFLTAAALVGGPAVAGFMLMAMIYIGSHISGGHYNPAVSVASWMRGGLSNENLLWYSVAQTFGALLGFWFVATAVKDPSGMLPGASGMGDPMPFVTELLLTFGFCLVILTVSKLAAYKSAGVQGLVVGLSYAAFLQVVPVAWLNPAIVLGGSLCAKMHGMAAGGFHLNNILV